MKKLTRLSLDELAKVMPVLTENEQRLCIGGSGNYPYYSYSEYESLLASAMWTGGYVEGQGYTLGEVTCSTSGTITNTFSSNSTNGYIPGNWGIAVNYTMNSYSVISNGIMNVGATMYNANGIYGDSYGANVVVRVNGTLISNTVLTTYSGGELFASGHCSLGGATINMPSGGLVEIVLNSYQIYSKYTGDGYGSGSVSVSEVIYSGYR
jgi:hypothetical protein